MGIGEQMDPVTQDALQSFLQRLGERYPGQGTFYLLGGCALGLLGSPRTTVDVDYTLEVETGSLAQFQEILTELAAEMRLDVEEVPLAEFMPLPSQARERRRLVGRYGQLDVCIFDLYSIALSKIARGFEADLEDVLFLLREGLIEFGELERHFNAILPEAPDADIIPSEFRDYFEEIRRRFQPSE
jgi:hypothetical protein